MDELEKSAHKVLKLKYHFVFCIKYRKDMFVNNDYCETFKYTCKQMEERYSMKFETIGFDEDHVHFMLKSLAKYSPSQLFRIVKSVTALRMFKTYHFFFFSFSFSSLSLKCLAKNLMTS